MSIEILRPNATIQQGGGSIVGGTTVHQVTSDNSGTTYFMPAGTATIVSFTPPSIPAFAYTVQMEVDKGSGFASTVQYVTNGDEERTLRTNVGWGSPITVGVNPTNLSVEAFDDADPRVTISNLTGFTDPHIYELYLEVTGVDDPEVSITSPTGTITTTNTPLVRWAPDLDVDGGVQTNYEVKIFDDATFDAGGFDADIDTPEVESGILVGHDVTWEPDEILANGTYHAAVRIAQTVNNEQIWSDWEFAEFVIDTAAIGTPTILLTPEEAAYRMRVDVTPYSIMTQYGFEEDGSQTTNLGTGTTQKRSTSLFGQDAKQGLWFNQADVTGAVTNAGINGATIDTSTSDHQVSMWVLADVGVAGHLYLDERSSGATLDTVSTAFTGTGEWQRVTVANPFSTGIRVRFRLAVDAAIETSIGHDAIQLVGDDMLLTDYFQVQKRQAGTDDWLDLRTPLGDGLISDAETAYDAEAPNGVAMEYRARAVSVSNTTDNIYSEWAVASDYVVWDTWTLKHPFRPELNMAVTLRSQPSRSKAIASGVLHALGRSSPIVVFDTRYCWEGTIAFRCADDDTRIRLQDITADGSPLLIQAPTDEYWKGTWVQFTNTYEQARVIDQGWMPYTFDTFNWVQVARPTSAMESWPTYLEPTIEEDE